MSPPLIGLCEATVMHPHPHNPEASALDRHAGRGGRGIFCSKGSDMKILIVEDNKRLAESLRAIIGNYYVVETVYSGEEALALVNDDDFGLIILDLNLPDVPGLEICRAIRRQNKNMPILVVTAEERTATMVELLDAGADDYITKPFRTRELRARMHVLLRRQETRIPANKQLVVGDLTLDLDKHCVIRDGVQIHLRSKEFIILEQLMLHPNMVMSRALLFNKAWDSADTTWTNTIDVHVNYLRNKIDRPFNSSSIETVHGLGYRLVDTSTAKP